MKLKTSFFKPVTLKKDILRFAPIWVIYTVGMFLILSEMGAYSSYDRFARNTMPDLVMAFGIVNLCYATLIAASLFGDLYNTKLCYSLHAMPYRRESWLMTHLLSGFLFSFLPNALVCLMFMVRLQDYWFLALYWLLASTLQFICFYGIATLGALLTGNRFAMLLVTAGINFVSMLVYATVELIYIPMLTGVITNVEIFTRLSPVVQIFTYDYFQFTRIKNESVNVFGEIENTYFYRFDGLADGWGYLAILGIAGLVAMGIGFWLYRKRHLEVAGDFIAFHRLKGLACVIMTLCIALCAALLGNLFGSLIVWLGVGLLLGFFGSLMLLERRLKVFRKKTWLGFGALALAVTLSLVATYCDWFGIESWIPEADQVASVTISDSRIQFNYSDSLTTLVEDPEDIQQIIHAHTDIYGRANQSANKRYFVLLEYKMKSGRTVSRYYYAPATGEGYQIIRKYLYNRKNILGFTDPAATAEQVQYMYSTFGEIPPAMYEKVLTALMKECDRNKVNLSGGGEYYLEYNLEDAQRGSIYRSLLIDATATELMALLKGPEVVMGYSDWETFLRDVKDCVLLDKEVGLPIQPSSLNGLLTALRKDIEAGCDLGGKWTADYDYLITYYVPYPNGRTEYREFYITAKAQNTMVWLVENGFIPKETPHA